MNEIVEMIRHRRDELCNDVFYEVIDWFDQLEQDYKVNDGVETELQQVMETYIKGYNPSIKKMLRDGYDGNMDYDKLKFEFEYRQFILKVKYMDFDFNIEWVGIDEYGYIKEIISTIYVLNELLDDCKGMRSVKLGSIVKKMMEKKCV